MEAIARAAGVRLGELHALGARRAVRVSDHDQVQRSLVGPPAHVRGEGHVRAGGRGLSRSQFTPSGYGATSAGLSSRDLIFATPAWCTSQSCGPMLDQVQALDSEYPDFNYVHVEVYENIQVTDRADLVLVGDNLNKSFLLEQIEKAEKKTAKKIRFVHFGSAEFRLSKIQEPGMHPLLVWSK